MPEIELTLAADAYPEWEGLWEGIRETLQNGKDAEIQYDAPMSVTYDEKKGILYVDNEGCVIPHEALLLGHTTKAAKSGLAGKFGEGLKIGLLCLVRSGHEVIIRSGSEVWTPRIKQSSIFKANVLAVRIDGGRKESKRVRVEIHDVDASDWATYRRRFLFLDEKERGEIIAVNGEGDILLAPHQKGRLYVRGIFVCCKPDMHVGYNFTSDDVQVDRDRKMVEDFDLKWRIRRMWQYAANGAWCKKQEDAKRARAQLVEMVFENADDVAGFDGMGSYLDAQTKEDIAERFASTYGNDAHPVTNVGDAIELDKVGRVGVQVPKVLAGIVETKLGTVASVKEKSKHEVVKVHSLRDLTVDERNAFLRAWAIAELAEVVSPEDMNIMSIVDFREGARTVGHYEMVEGAVSVAIAKSELTHWSKALEVILHEFAHKATPGADHNATFLDYLESAWRKCIVAAESGAVGAVRH
jgi:hypothetical protein